MWGTTKRYGERSESGTGWEEWERADAEDAEAQSSLRWELEQSRKGLRAEGEELAHVAEFLVAGVEKFLDALVGEDEELALEGVPEEFGGGFVVTMGAAVGFGDDFVHNAEVLQVRGHDLHGDGRGFGFGGIAPDDGRTAFWRNHGVEAVFEDIDAVTDGDGQCAAGAAFAGDGDDNGNGETRHFPEVASDGFALAAFFSV